MRKPYTTQYRHEGKYLYVDGPGDGLGFYSHTLWPNLSFKDKENAERAAKIANIAFEQGYLEAQQNIKKALGI
jgi:hypothetical protein